MLLCLRNNFVTSLHDLSRPLPISTKVAGVSTETYTLKSTINPSICTEEVRAGLAAADIIAFFGDLSYRLLVQDEARGFHFSMITICRRLFEFAWYSCQTIVKTSPVSSDNAHEVVFFKGNATLHHVALLTRYGTSTENRVGYSSQFRSTLRLCFWHKIECTDEGHKESSHNALKEEKLKQEEKYLWAVVDGVKENVGNFGVEPPRLFRGRGEHPKKRMRIHPSDITMNIGKGVPVPECPIQSLVKSIRNRVTWLAFWNDPINPKEFNYVFLAAGSALKGQSDKKKYEKARNLTNHIDNIRATYTKNFTSKDVTKKQISVATYLIDKLAIMAGNEKVKFDLSFGSVREQDRYLPIANISRIMKRVLPPNGKIGKDAKDTVQECVSEFISFITREHIISDKCQEEKRKTVKGEDLLWAMSTLGFENYLEPLKLYLARYREVGYIYS
ncbi:hypothetical protein Bca52824_027700 [Brassica carinata]|uniref:DNA topoisomerase I eukaryotic-type domain-containing protein n=1 Tax=Brassica carinata TaxID=52824 RepID=A0A8X7VAY5_BRACI|nr:hypothetical protein Bca52824_027700 [Brassica carinata]